MKLKGNIIQLDTTGDGIRIVLQAPIGRADWKPIEKQTIVIDDTATNRRTFYLGRAVTLEIKP